MSHLGIRSSITRGTQRIALAILGSTIYGFKKYLELGCWIMSVAQALLDFPTWERAPCSTPCVTPVRQWCNIATCINMLLHLFQRLFAPVYHLSEATVCGSKWTSLSWIDFIRFFNIHNFGRFRPVRMPAVLQQIHGIATVTSRKKKTMIYRVMVNILLVALEAAMSQRLSWWLSIQERWVADLGEFRSMMGKHRKHSLQKKEETENIPIGYLQTLKLLVLVLPYPVCNGKLEHAVSLSHVILFGPQKKYKALLREASIGIFWTSDYSTSCRSDEIEPWWKGSDDKLREAANKRRLHTPKQRNISSEHGTWKIPFLVERHFWRVWFSFGGCLEFIYDIL